MTSLHSDPPKHHPTAPLHGENLANSRFQSKMANWFHFVSTILPFASGEAHFRLPLNLNIHKSLRQEVFKNLFVLLTGLVTILLKP